MLLLKFVQIIFFIFLFSFESEVDGAAADDDVGRAGNHAVAKDQSGSARTKAEVGAGQNARYTQVENRAKT